MNLLASINENAMIAPAIVLIIGFTLLGILVVAAAVVVISRYHSYAPDGTLTVGRNKGIKTRYVFLSILGLGLIIRILLTFFVDGYFASSDNEYRMVTWLFDKGFEGFYISGNFDLATSSPLMVYVYFITAGIGKAMGIDTASPMMSFFIKLPYLLADIVLAFAVYKIASKHINKYVGLALSGIVTLCPVFFVMSSMWGSAYSLYAVIVFFAFYFLLKRKIPMMVVFTTIMFSLIPDSVFLAPVFLAYMVYLLVKAIITIVKTKPSFDGAMNDAVMKNVVDVPVCLIISVCAVYLMALPAYFTDYGAGFFDVYYHLFVGPIDKIAYFGMNALNVFNIFGQNALSLTVDFPRLIFAILFFVLILAVVLLIFLSKKNRANLVLIGAFIVATVTTYFVGATEWSAMPALLLLILSFIIIQDKRILKIFSVYSIIYLVNALLAMLYSNNIAMAVTQSTVSIADLTFSNAPAGFVFSIIFSVISVVTHLYFTVVMLDISMTKHRCLFPETPRKNTVRGILGSWIKSK